MCLNSYCYPIHICPVGTCVLVAMPPKGRGWKGKEPESSGVDNTNIGDENGLHATLKAMTMMFERQMQSGRGLWILFWLGC